MSLHNALDPMLFPVQIARLKFTLCLNAGKAKTKTTEVRVEKLLSRGDPLHHVISHLGNAGGQADGVKSNGELEFSLYRKAGKERGSRVLAELYRPSLAEFHVGKYLFESYKRQQYQRFAKASHFLIDAS